MRNTVHCRLGTHKAVGQATYALLYNATVYVLHRLFVCGKPPPPRTPRPCATNRYIVDAVTRTSTCRHTMPRPAMAEPTSHPSRHSWQLRDAPSSGERTVGAPGLGCVMHRPVVRGSEHCRLERQQVKNALVATSNPAPCLPCFPIKIRVSHKSVYSWNK